MKSNAKSELLRNEGNQFYAKKNFFDGILKYNESLCCAEAESENMGLAYANRSAVYFEMKLYDKCLENIELAKRNHYPEKNLEILKKRESKCLDLMKQERSEVKQQEVDTLNFFKLSHPCHKNLPNVADCLELKNDKKFGRHIVTNRALSVGDVIAIEEPFCRVIQEKFVHQRCTICFKDDLLDLQPCLNCQKAMFCKDCVKFSLKSFHQFECPLIDILISSVLSSSIRMAIRTFFVGLTLFEGSVENFEKFMKDNPNFCTVFDHGSSTSMKDKLLEVNSLIADADIKVDEEVLEQLFTATSVLQDIWLSHHDFIRSFLKKQFQIGTLNYHEIFAWSLKKGGFSDDDVNEFEGKLAYKRGVVSTGNGSYPFSALINHSCNQNVTRIFIDDKIVLIVRNPISKGEQIFDNYGYNFTNVPKDYRQQELMQQYKFKCNCSACANNWPLLPSLKAVDKACLNKAKKISRELSLTVNQKKAIENFKGIFSFIERGQNNYPSLEVCSLQQSFSALTEIICQPSFQFP